MAAQFPVRQLPLDLSADAAMGPDDFIEGASNRAAMAAVAAFPDWPAPVLLLRGPEGSGKSHLARVFAMRAGGAIVAAGDLPEADPLALAAAPATVVEDADRSPESGLALFHLINAVLASGGRLVVTARDPVGRWPGLFPDLASRLRAAHPVSLGAPDDALLARLLVKLLADRQIEAPPPVLAFVLKRIGRSFADAGRFAAAADRETLARGRPLTRALAGEILGEAREDAAPDSAS